MQVVIEALGIQWTRTWPLHSCETVSAWHVVQMQQRKASVGEAAESAEDICLSVERVI